LRSLTVKIFIYWLSIQKSYFS